MPCQPIENYGIVGNMRTVALVSIQGSIDWYCHPYFDSPSLFGALLDDRKGGSFSIRPRAENVRYKQFYWPGTNIRSQGEALGNFPQAFTHLALISAAFNLDRTLGSRP